MSSCSCAGGGACVACHLVELRGYSPHVAQVGFNAQKLKEAGYSPKDLKSAGFKASLVFKLHELKDELSLAELLQDEGFELSDLKEAGWTAGDLRLKADISCSSLLEIGYTLEQLHEGGFKAQDLRAFGVPIKDMKVGGYTVAELKSSGSSFVHLKEVSLLPHLRGCDDATAGALAQYTACCATGPGATVVVWVGSLMLPACACRAPSIP